MAGKPGCRDVNDLGMQEETAAADVDPGQQSAAGLTIRAAVVIHAAKHDDMDGFRAVVHTAMAELGWAEPLWLETRPDDTGEWLAREAVRSGVDLVLASGGDAHRLSLGRHWRSYGQQPGRGTGCWPKKRVNSALASGPRGSV
jgi:hypothetical protein